MQVLAADQVRIDERTDVREVVCADVDADCLEALECGIEAGTVTVEFGLLGWGGHNATLRDSVTETTYHATIQD